MVLKRIKNFKLFNPDTCPLAGMVLVNCLKDCEYAPICLERFPPSEILVRRYLDAFDTFEERVALLLKLTERKGFGMKVLLAFNHKLEWSVRDMASHIGAQHEDVARRWLDIFIRAGLIKLRGYVDPHDQRRNRDIYFLPVKSMSASEGKALKD